MVDATRTAYRRLSRHRRPDDPETVAGITGKDDPL